LINRVKMIPIPVKNDTVLALATTTYQHHP